MKTHRVDTKDYEIRFLMDKSIIANWKTMSSEKVEKITKSFLVQ